MKARKVTVEFDHSLFTASDGAWAGDILLVSIDVEKYESAYRDAFIRGGSVVMQGDRGDIVTGFEDVFGDFTIDAVCWESHFIVHPNGNICLDDVQSTHGDHWLYLDGAITPEDVGVHTLGKWYRILYTVQDGESRYSYHIIENHPDQLRAAISAVVGIVGDKGTDMRQARERGSEWYNPSDWDHRAWKYDVEEVTAAEAAVLRKYPTG